MLQQNKKVPKPRLTVVDLVYYQVVNKDPECAESRFDLALNSMEQVWLRYDRVGEEWKPLDCGWIETASMLFIENMEEPPDNLAGSAGPTILEVKYEGSPGCWEILPGQSMRARPSDLSLLRIRSCQGEAKFTIRAYPR